jgi:AcrR family transcriptional regulator
VRRAERAAETRERILQAAVQTLATDGVEGMRIARVAGAAGVSATLVHYHFETREQLLGEALERSYGLAADLRGSAGSRLSRPALERLVEKVEDSLPLPGEQEREWQLWVELWLAAMREPSLRVAAARVYRRLHDSLRALLVEGGDQGEFAVADPDRVADRVLALIDGFGVRALLGDPALPVERAREEILALLERELGVSLPRTVK